MRKLALFVLIFGYNLKIKVMEKTFEEKLEAFVKLSKIIAEANGEWKPKYNESKYYDGECYFAVFHYGYSAVDTDEFSLWYISNCGDENLTVPSTLLIKSKDLAKKIVAENIELYEVLYGFSDAEYYGVDENL